MFSLCISDEKKFISPNRGTVTVVPVYVEFNSIYPIDSESESDLPSLEISEPGIELLHTVASLYYKNLPNVPLNIIYSSLCRKGVKTLLLLRHGEEILNEWKKESKKSQQINLSTDPFPSSKVDYSPGSKLTSPDEISSSDSSSLSSPSSFMINAESNFKPRTIDLKSPSLEFSMTSSSSKTFSSGIISDLEDLEVDRFEIKTDLIDNRSSKPSMNRGSSWTKEPSTRNRLSSSAVYREMEQKIEHCFQDEEIQSSDDPHATDRDGNPRLRRLIDSGSQFLDLVNERRRKRFSITDKSGLDLNHVSIEHRIIASISFHKDYRLPLMPIIFIDWLIVCDPYRHSRIGSYLVKKVKSSSLAGSYHLICVNCLSPSVRPFFRSCNFIEDGLSEARLRPLLSGHLTTPIPPEKGLASGSGFLFYYPSFSRTLHHNTMEDFHSSVIPCETNVFPFDLSIKSISEEIDYWKERSLESYHDQLTLILRLKADIIKLHNQLRQRDKQLKEVKQENKELRHIVTQTNAIAAISTIDELGSLFESIKDLCSVVR